MAAVAGSDYDLALAAKARSIEVDALAPAWQELRAHHVFSGDRFAHDIVREAVLGVIAPPLARELHARVAACLQGRDAAPERVAHHYAGAENWPAAAAASERAAMRAERLGQREDQLRHADAAEAWYRRAGDPARAQQVGIRALGPSLEQEGSELADARAQRLESACSNPAQRALVDAHRARIALVQTDSGRALQFADAAALGAGPQDVTARALSAAIACVALAWRGDFDAAVARIEPVVANIESIADPWLRHEVWSGYGIVLATEERWRQIVTLVPRAIADARRHGDAAGEADAMSSMAAAAGVLGDVVAAVRYGRQAHELHIRMDNPQGERVNRMNLAFSLAPQGLFVEALELLESVLEEARRSGKDTDLYRFTIEDLLAHVCLEVGAFDRAAELLVDDPPPEPPVRRLIRSEVRAYAAALAGDVSQAAARWRQALVATEAAPVSEMRKARAGALASAWLLPEEALAMCRRALEVAERRDSPVLRQLALLRRAQTWLRCGKAREAHDDVADLLPNVRMVQSIYISKPESWLTAANVLASIGNADAARECLAHGRDWLMAAQVPPDARRDFLERHPVHRALLQKAAERFDE
jgi:tetratricopeptide (TPR) repeat protein